MQHPSSTQPQVLPPARGLRAHLAQTVFTEQRIDLLAHWLDDCFRVPGTPWRFGLDGIVGLVPFAGDALAGLASGIILVAAWAHGVRRVTLGRMLVNVAVGILLGSVPLLGDLFDVAWKPNRRNYQLLQARLREPRRQAWGDWLFFLLLLAALVCLLAVPLLALGWVAHAWLGRR